MSYATARRDIESRFQKNWATTKIAFDNSNFTPPDQKSNDYWVRLRIFEDVADRINIGEPMVERVSGTIVVGIYGPLNSGTNTIRQYAATIAEIFRDKQFNGITCGPATPQNVGELGGWYVFNVSWAFRYDGIYSTK